MSMIAYFRVVSPTIIDDLATYDDEDMSEFLFPEDEEGDTTQDIDKAWDALGHLLTLATEGRLTTLLGGSEIGPDLGYGSARWMSPEVVREMSRLLVGIDRASLLMHYDGASLRAADVYPEIWDDSPELQDYLGDNFEIVRQVFLDGAQRGAAVLGWLA